MNPRGQFSILLLGLVSKNPVQVNCDVTPEWCPWIILGSYLQQVQGPEIKMNAYMILEPCFHHSHMQTFKPSLLMIAMKEANRHP